MEAVAADAVLLIVFVGDTVEVVLGLNGEVEGGVEHCHLRHIGHHVVDGLSAHDVAGYMQRCQVDERLLLVDNITCNLHTLRKILAAMGKTMSHSANFLDAGDNTRLWVGKGSHNHTQTLGMVGDGTLGSVLLALAGISENATL